MASEYPLIVSFFSGDVYYRQSADRLAANCDALKLDYDIVDLDKFREGGDWVDLCRYKIEFYREKLIEHKRSILWIDVDTQLIRTPDMLRTSRMDMIGYIRNYKSPRDFDPYKTGRFWSPGILFFGHTDNTLAFLEYVNEIMAEEKRPATDDYFINQAWQTYDKELNIGLLAEKTCAMNESKVNDSTVFLHGLSGNVKKFKSDVLQHEPIFSAGDFIKNKFLAAATVATKEKEVQTAARILRYGRKSGVVDPEMVLREAYFVRLGGDALGALQTLEESYNESRSSMVLRRLAEWAIEKQDIARGRWACDTLVASEDNDDRAFGQAMMTRLGLEERALAAAIPLRARLPLWWMETPYPGNFGDVLNPYLIEKITQIPPRRTSRGAGLLAIGSIIKFAKEGTTVWGSGTPRMTDTLSPLARYTAVRGPLTRQLVLSSGGTCPDVFGDPALLLPKVYHPDIPKRYALGLIKHHVHQQEAAPAEDVLEIDVTCIGYKGIENFVDQLLSCERIVSSSLHGIIAAHAYGIPACWGVYSKGASLAGDDTKFQDHFLSVGLSRATPVDLSEMRSITAKDVGRLQFDCPRDLRLEPLLEQLLSIAAKPELR